MTLRVIACAVVVVLAVPGVAGAQEPPEVTAEGAVLWDPADRAVLHGVDEAVGLPPASTTKIMTVLLAIEDGTLDDTVTVSPAAAALGRVPGAATLNLQAGQQVPMRSLLAGLMLRSGNDASLAVAEHVAGSEEAFVDRMNERAGELGLADTVFLNASGLTDDPTHRASPVALAELTEVAMANEEFASWAGTAALDLPGFPPWESRNELLGTYAGADGVKTGFTTLAGQCLVASATREGRTLYAVVLGSEASFTDASRLLDHGFDDYRRVQPLDAGAVASRYRWAAGAVDVVAAGTLGRTVAQDADASWRIDWEPAVPLPVDARTVVGRAELLLEGEVVDRVDLVTAEGVPAGGEPPPGARAGAAAQDALRAFSRLLQVERAA